MTDPTVTPREPEPTPGYLEAPPKPGETVEFRPDQGKLSGIVADAPAHLISVDFQSDGTGAIRVYHLADDGGPGALALTVNADGYSRNRSEAVNRLIRPGIFAEISGGISRATFHTTGLDPTGH